MLCPRGLRGLPVGKKVRDRGVWFIGRDWKGGKNRRAKEALPDWNWRVSISMQNRGGLVEGGVGMR